METRLTDEELERFNHENRAGLSLGPGTTRRLLDTIEWWQRRADRYKGAVERAKMMLMIHDAHHAQEVLVNALETVEG